MTVELQGTSGMAAVQASHDGRRFRPVGFGSFDRKAVSLEDLSQPIGHLTGLACRARYLDERHRGFNEAVGVHSGKYGFGELVGNHDVGFGALPSPKGGQTGQRNHRIFWPSSLYCPRMSKVVVPDTRTFS